MGHKPGSFWLFRFSIPAVMDVDSCSWLDSVDGGTGDIRDNDIVNSRLSWQFFLDDGGGGTHDDVEGMISAGSELRVTFNTSFAEVFDHHCLYIYIKIQVEFLVSVFFW